jgi:hypothetical protein
MRQDQLQQARLTRWRQDGNALLTLDDAERWLADTPLCLYLPRQQHLPVPAPSFVEAIAGRADATPGPEAIAAAAQMLARLVASGAVVALNLFGAAPGIGVSSFVGEHPDFLATPEALPYLYALQAERNPKREPTTAGNGRVSPLAAETWKLLERGGALTTSELRSQLGREVTEAAVLRALAELWHTMRVVPIPAENPQEGAHWELLSARHGRELNIGSKHSQTTALSILASFYLQSAVAASEEEVEIFLSPVASRSRIRDVVHGLSTTRQLGSFPLNGEGQLYVEGSLPEIAEEEPLVAGAIGEDAGLEQNEPSMIEAAAAGAESPAQRRERPPVPRRSFADRARGSFAARDRRPPAQGRPPRAEGGFRRPQRSDSRGPARGGFPPSARGNFRRAEGNEAPGEGTARPARPSFERSDRPARFDRGERGAPRTGSFAKRSGSFDKRSGSFDKRSGSFDKRRSFDRDRPAGRGSRPEKPFRGKPFTDRPPRSGEGAERPRFRPAAGAGARPSGSSRFGSSQSRSSQSGPSQSGPSRFGQGGPGRPDRPFRKPQGDRPGGPRRFEGRPGAAARAGGSGAAERFSRPRRDGESRPQGDRPFKRPYSPAGDRPPRRGPAGSYGKSGGGDRPARRFTPRPRPDAAAPAAGERESRPFRPAGQRPSRPGGFSKPAGSFRKPAFGKPSFGKPSFGKAGSYRKPAGDRPATSGEGSDRPRSPRPAFGPRSAASAAGSDARKSGGFRKPGGPGRSFGKPRPAGAGSGKPRPAGAGKGRTSTTTSSGKPRRPGGFGAARPGGPGRPPAKGGFKTDFKPRPKAAHAKRPATKRPDAKRPGGFGAPKRKPRSEGDEG